MNCKINVAAWLLLMGIGAGRAAATTALPVELIIDTTPAWTIGGVAALGGNGVSAYGQTFIAPPGAKLGSFTFFINEFNVGPSVSVRGYVAKWNNATTRPTGSILYTSEVFSSTNNHGQDGWEALTIPVGGLLLEGGATYVAFLGTYGLFQSIDDELIVGRTNGDAYSSGQFYYAAQNARTAQLSGIANVPWEQLAFEPAGTDLAFRMNFTIPEPPGLTLVAGAAVGGILRRARRGRAACAGTRGN